MRTSKDIYKLPNGVFMDIGQSSRPPERGVIWTGFNYKTQQWTVAGVGYETAGEALEAGKKNCHYCGQVKKNEVCHV